MKRKLGGWSVYPCWILSWGLVYISSVDLRAEDAWLWAKDIGGLWSTRVGIDGVGNVYALGEFAVGDTGNAVETIAGFTLRRQTNYANGFVVKYDQSGSVQWVRQVGAQGRAMDVDFGGSVYVSGYVSGKAKIGNVEFQSKPNRQLIFVARYDSAGEVLWARQVAEISKGSVNCVTVDASGNYYIAGNYASDTTSQFGLATGTGGILVFGGATSSNKSDIFVAKFKSNGEMVWFQTVGGIAEDNVDSMVVSETGECYFTGYFGSLSDTVSIGSATIQRQLPSARFLSKLDQQGKFEWTREINVEDSFFSHDSLAIDDKGSLFVMGVFRNTATLGNVTVVSTNASDFYIARLNQAGEVAWLRTGGNCCENEARGIALDKNGDIYVTGEFSFQISQNTNQPIEERPVVRKYSQNGDLLGEEYGSGVTGNDIAIDSMGNVFVAGTLGLNGSLGETELSAAGAYGMSGFIAKLSPFARSGLARIQIIGPKEVRVSLQGFEEADYRIETSVNLEDWTPFLTWPGTNGSFEFSDFRQPNMPAKFYRIIAVP